MATIVNIASIAMASTYLLPALLLFIAGNDAVLSVNNAHLFEHDHCWQFS